MSNLCLVVALYPLRTRGDNGGRSGEGERDKESDSDDAEADGDLLFFLRSRSSRVDRFESLEYVCFNESSEASWSSAALSIASPCGFSFSSDICKKQSYTSLIAIASRANPSMKCATG